MGEGEADGAKDVELQYLTGFGEERRVYGQMLTSAPTVKLPVSSLTWQSTS